MAAIQLDFHPLTRDRWADFERLFGPRGACAGCWCTFWKLRGKAFDENTGEPARRMQQSIVASGVVPGLLAYTDNGEPVGWCAVEPRREYPRLAHSRVLAPVDDAEVWSVTCFYVAKAYRRQGVTVALLRAATEHVRRQGGRIIEGYPVEPRQGNMPAVFAYTGMASAFRQAGFVEVARNSPTRPIFRYYIEA